MQQVLGTMVLVAAIAALISEVARKAGMRSTPRPSVTPAGRRAAMLILAAGAIVASAPALFPPLRRGVFEICASCPVLPSLGEPATRAPQGPALDRLLSAAWYYAATVLPVFVLACLLSGVILARSDRFRIAGFWRSFGLAALLPLCACGAVPIGRAMLDSGDRGRRDGLVFIAAAPLLSPVIIVLALTAIGPLYAALRVLGAALLACVVASVAAPMLSPRPVRGMQEAPAVWGERRGSVLEAGFGTLRGLMRYALYGIAVGAVFTTFVPAAAVQALVRPGVLSMAAAVLVGVPVNMCGGEEILLTAPLVGMGLGLGHAVAFAMAGTGICLSSMPLLAAALGRKATMAMVAAYVAVPFAFGLLLNALLAIFVP